MGKDVNTLADYDKIQNTDTTIIKSPKGYILQQGKIKI